MVCSPGCDPLHSYVKSFQEYGVFSFHSVAGFQAPPSTLTSTAFSGVPSVSAKPTALKVLPVRVTRATADFRRIRLTQVSSQITSSPIVSLFSVT